VRSLLRLLPKAGRPRKFRFQFDFLNPGARSLALGSAFIAVADDATAAFTNPAGLTFLVKPECLQKFDIGAWKRPTCPEGGCPSPEQHSS
jgi:hypothetical protein